MMASVRLIVRPRILPKRISNRIGVPTRSLTRGSSNSRVSAGWDCSINRQVAAPSAVFRTPCSATTVSSSRCCVGPFEPIVHGTRGHCLHQDEVPYLGVAFPLMPSTRWSLRSNPFLLGVTMLPSFRSLDGSHFHVQGPSDSRLPDIAGQELVSRTERGGDEERVVHRNAMVDRYLIRMHEDAPLVDEPDHRSHLPDHLYCIFGAYVPVQSLCPQRVGRLLQG